MGSFDDVTVVIPTLNEAEAIGAVLDEVLSVGVPRERVLVVDGGSTDGTVEIARSRGVRVVRQVGRGKAMAIYTAVREARTPILVFMDGDYTYPAKHIPELVEAVRSGYDLVIGVRVPVEEGAQGRVYALGNRALTWFFNLLFGTSLRDVLSGMYAVRRDVLEEVPFESRGFGVESEIAAHVVATGGRVGEVVIGYRRRLGEKKLGVSHGFSILLEMLRLARRYNPTFLVFAAGSLLLVPGLALGGWVAYRYLEYGVMHHVKGLAAIGLTAAGVQSLLLALLALYLKRSEIRLLSSIRRLRRECAPPAA